MTRDRKELVCEWNGKRFLLIDTGGVDSRPRRDHAPDRQAGSRRDRGGRPRPLRRRRARRHHARATRSSPRFCARAKSPVLVLANKIDDPRRDVEALEFHRLGLGEPMPLSALHGHGTGDLLDEIVARLPGDGKRAGRRGGDPRRDPRPAERRQVVALERARRAGARDRLRRPGHDARRDRHDPRARRADVPARRHRRASAASASSGRASSTTRSSARSKRPSAPTSHSS